MRQMRKLGPLEQILGMIPGMGSQMGKMPEGALEQSEKQLRQVEAMICSMTTGERREPTLINGSRRRRIAAGSGTTIQDVNRLLTQFDQMKKMMRGLHAGRPRRTGRGPAGDGGVGSRTGKHAGSPTRRTSGSRRPRSNPFRSGRR